MEDIWFKRTFLRFIHLIGNGGIITIKIDGKKKKDFQEAEAGKNGNLNLEG